MHAATTMAQQHDDALRVRLERFLSADVGAPVAVTSLRRLSTGLSWMTAAVTADLPSAHPAPADLILKLGPTFGLMSPYSARPQALAGMSFAGTTVPVPPVRWFSDDDAVLGGPFLISDRVAGSALNPFVAGYEASLLADLRALGVQFAATLAAIHACDWRSQPIAALAPEPAAGAHAQREVLGWRERARRWALRPVPMLDLAGTWLEKNCPPNAQPCIVHGDYRVGNFLSTDDQITAILDWEMVHVGDRHEDLAWAAMPEFRLSGLISLQDFKRHYHCYGGAAIDDDVLDYYLVFCLYKLAVINLGASCGFEQGANDLRLACLGLTVSGYLDRLGRALAKKW